ncbi:MAG: 2-succinyl-5-enolpyruvyl-6-hydroxy-3-cyclohexene-1-carboxylic-acid synthase, partial [Micrococcales bacterium]|nr:2-succinyl-5-enolpyruvyl-6-hydroxy-3-cyclohexene-1-carboxylic-acid synthase [Micrococcales bacterium]
DHGGAIFEGLEVGQTHLRPAFERFFATPQRADLAALARTYGYDYRLVEDTDGLAPVLATAVTGRQLVEVKLERSLRVQLEAQLRRISQRERL